MSTLKNGSFNAHIEASISKSLETEWKIQGFIPNEIGAMREVAMFEGGDGFNIFVKLGQNPWSYDQFTQEAWGLRHITENSEIATPKVIDVLDIDGAALLILEAIKTVPIESKQDWEILGRGLATLHKTTRDSCGLETHSYLGIWKQNNHPADNWPDYYKVMMLNSFYCLAESKKITDDEMKNVEETLNKLIEKLPEICGTVQPFSLLHGDPWLGNMLYDGKQLVLIDCSIYYGNREMDISTVEIFKEFSPISDYFLDAYHECYPIDPGFKDRKELWYVNQYFGWVTYFGDENLPRLMDAMRKYL